MAKYLRVSSTGNTIPVQPISSLYLDGYTRKGGIGSFLFFDAQGSTDPISNTDLRGLFVDSSNRLSYWNGTTTARLTGTGGVATSWEDIYSVDQTFAMTATTDFTISQSTNGGILVLTKTGTGAGVPLTLNNAGTGNDINIITTRASSTGVILRTFHNSASAADNDVIFEHQFRGNDDAGSPAEVAYGRFRWLSTDVSAGTEDAAFQIAMMLGGTIRTTLDITGDLMIYGTGQADAVISSSGANDLILETNSGTNSGTIRIYDGTNGNIEFLNNGSGDVTIPTSGIVLGGTTPTRCSFAVAGTSGDGFLITTSTITSGDVLAIDHTSSGTLSGGNLLNLLVDSTTVFNIGETGNVTIVGSANTDVFTVSAGDLVVTDGSLLITDADNANSFAVVNNTATTVSVISLDGSGTFTGNTTAAWMTLMPSGLTTGTALYIATAAATTLSHVVDITSSHTTGKGITITCSGTMTGVGKALEIIADSATTAGAVAGEGIISVSADGLTTGVAVRVESLSNEVFTSGALGKFDHSAVGTTVAAVSTAGLFQVTSSITESGTSTQAFDVVNFSRTSIHNTAGTLTASGAVLKLDRVSTQTDATLTDTVVTLEVNSGATSTGDGLFINNDAIAGIAINIDAENTTADIINVQCAPLTTGIALDFPDADGLTTGGIINAVSNSSDTGTRNLIFVHNNHASANDTVVLSLRQDSTDHTLFIDHDGATGSAIFIDAETTTGVTVDLDCAALTQGKVIDISNLDAITTGKVIHIDATGVTQTDGILVHIDSASTALTSTGRLLLVDHTGNAGVSTVIAEVASAAADETVILKVTASAALAAGVALQVSAASATTAKIISCANADALTTGNMLNLISNSSDSSTRNLAFIHNDNASATGTTILALRQDAPTSTNYWKMATFANGSNTVTLWIGSGTTGNGNLSATAGDILFNGGSNKPEYNTGTTNWTALV
jgi:hypothetical protein